MPIRNLPALESPLGSQSIHPIRLATFIGERFGGIAQGCVSWHTAGRAIANDPGTGVALWIEEDTPLTDVLDLIDAVWSHSPNKKLLFATNAAPDVLHRYPQFVSLSMPTEPRQKSDSQPLKIKVGETFELAKLHTDLNMQRIVADLSDEPVRIQLEIEPNATYLQFIQIVGILNRTDTDDGVEIVHPEN